MLVRGGVERGKGGDDLGEGYNQDRGDYIQMTPKDLEE